MHLYLVLKLLVFQNTLINYIYHKLLYIKVGGKGQLYPEKVHRNQNQVYLVSCKLMKQGHFLWTRLYLKRRIYFIMIITAKCINHMKSIPLLFVSYTIIKLYAD